MKPCIFVTLNVWRFFFHHSTTSKKKQEKKLLNKKVKLSNFLTLLQIKCSSLLHNNWLPKKNHTLFAQKANFFSNLFHFFCLLEAETSKIKKIKQFSATCLRVKEEFKVNELKELLSTAIGLNFVAYLDYFLVIWSNFWFGYTQINFFVFSAEATWCSSFSRIIAKLVQSVVTYSKLWSVYTQVIFLLAVLSRLPTVFQGQGFWFQLCKGNLFNFERLVFNG